MTVRNFARRVASEFHIESGMTALDGARPQIHRSVCRNGSADFDSIVSSSDRSHDPDNRTLRPPMRVGLWRAIGYAGATTKPVRYWVVSRPPIRRGNTPARYIFNAGFNLIPTTSWFIQVALEAGIRGWTGFEYTPQSYALRGAIRFTWVMANVSRTVPAGLGAYQLASYFMTNQTEFITDEL